MTHNRFALIVFISVFISAAAVYVVQESYADQAQIIAIRRSIPQLTRRIFKPTVSPPKTIPGSTSTSL